MEFSRRWSLWILISVLSTATAVSLPEPAHEEICMRMDTSPQLLRDEVVFRLKQLGKIG